MINVKQVDELRKAALENEHVAYLLDFIWGTIYSHLGEVSIVEANTRSDRLCEIDSILLAAEFAEADRESK